MWFCTETVKILHTQLNSNKKASKINDICAFSLFLFLVKIGAIYPLLVCKAFGPKIRTCKFFDKSQVWEKGLRAVYVWRGFISLPYSYFLNFVPHFSDWCGLIFWQALVLETLLGAPPRSEITTALSNLSTPSNRSRWGWGWWWRHLTCWGRRWWWCWRWRWCRRGWAWWCQGGGRRSRAARGTWRCPSSSRLLHRVAGRRSWGWLWLQWWWWWPLHHDDVWWWCGVCVCVTKIHH